MLTERSSRETGMEAADMVLYSTPLFHCQSCVERVGYDTTAAHEKEGNPMRIAGVITWKTVPVVKESLRMLEN